MVRNVGLRGLGFVWALALLCSCGGGEPGDMAVFDIQPRVGSPSGEQSIQILGANFRQDIGYSVYFGSQRAGGVTILDTGTLLVSTPAHDQGAVDVVIAADDGPAFRIVSGFEYVNPAEVGTHEGPTGGGTGEERY